MILGLGAAWGEEVQYSKKKGCLFSREEGMKKNGGKKGNGFYF